MDPTLVAAAIAAAASYIAELGKEAVKSTAKEAGKSVWEWIKGKLTSAAGKEAVTDLESAPGDTVNRQAVEAALSKFLKSDPGAVAELAELVGQAGGTSVEQTASVGRDGNTANVYADGGIVTQNSGSGSISVNVGSGRGKAPKAG